METMTRLRARVRAGDPAALEGLAADLAEIRARLEQRSSTDDKTRLALVEELAALAEDLAADRDRLRAELETLDRVLRARRGYGATRSAKPTATEDG